MNVSLTPHLEKFVYRKLAGGGYQTASEVVRDALRLLEAKDRSEKARLEELRGEIRVGLEQLDRGQAVPFDDETVKRIKATGRNRLRAAKAPKSGR